ncbi:MAG: leucine-rich repeat domain-containing protein [Mycoplasma sp.]
MKKDNEDIKIEGNSEKIESIEQPEATDEVLAEELSPWRQKWEEHKNKSWILLILLLLLFIGGGVGIAAATGAFNQTENTPVPPMKGTMIKNKNFDKTLQEFKTAIGYENSTTAIKDFTTHFEVINEVVGAEYFITNFDSKKLETILNIRVSDVLDESGNHVQEKNFPVELTTTDVPPPVIKTTTILDSNYDGTLEQFKNAIGYDSGSMKFDDIHSYFEINDEVENSEYFITIESNLKELKTTVNIIASQAYNNGEIELNKNFPVELTTTDEDVVIKNMFNITDDGVLSINDTTTWDYANWGGKLVIPTEFNEIKVKRLAYDINEPDQDNFGMKIRDKLSSLTFEEDSELEAISPFAFSHSGKLTGSLKIPNSVKKIGDSAFVGAENLNGTLTIGNEVFRIGDSAFSACKNLKGDLIIPDSVETIGNLAFQGCNGFDGNLIIGNSVQTIGEWAFAYCSNFKNELIIPDSVESMGQFIFDNCSVPVIWVRQKWINELTWQLNYQGEVKNLDSPSQSILLNKIYN